MSLALVAALSAATVVGSCALGSLGLPGSRCCCSTHARPAADSLQAAAAHCCGDGHVCGARQPALETSHAEARIPAPVLIPEIAWTAAADQFTAARPEPPTAATGPPYRDVPTRFTVLLI